MLQIKKGGESLNKTNKIVYMAMLLALEIILTRFLSIQTPIIRIGFGFIPIALAAVLFGPLLAGTMAAVADILGMIIFPKGAYFPGFTLSAFISGAVYGVVLYKKNISIIKVALAALIIIVGVDLFMNTYWLTIITGKAASVLIGPRITKSIIMFPIQVVLTYTVIKIINKFQFVPKLNNM